MDKGINLMILAVVKHISKVFGIRLFMGVGSGGVYKHQTPYTVGLKTHFCGKNHKHKLCSSDETFPEYSFSSCYLVADAKYYMCVLRQHSRCSITVITELNTT